MTDNTFTVHDVPERQRFELAVDEHVAFLQYERKGNRIVLIHTEVPPALRGRGLSNVLTKHALDAARAEGLIVIATCPSVRAYLKKHPADAAGVREVNSAETDPRGRILPATASSRRLQAESPRPRLRPESCRGRPECRGRP